MEWIAAESGVAYGDSPDATKAHRVLADHGRGMTFLVGDGVTPVERGAGLRPPPDHPPGRPARPAHRHADPVPPGPRRRRDRADGAGLPRARRARGADPARPRRRGGALRARRSSAGWGSSRRPPRRGSISGEDAFTLQATYGFPIELTVELARERGLGVDEDGYVRLMEQHREISRAGGGKGEVQQAAEFAARRRVHDRVRRLGEDRGADADRRARGPGRRALPREAPRVAVLPGGRRPGERRRRARGGRRLSRRAARGLPARGRPGAPLRGRGLRRRRPREGGRAVAGALPDDGEPHGHAPPAPGAARGAGRARAPGRLGRAARQAALRLHAPAGAHARGAPGGRAARQRGGLREPPGAHVHRPDRRGAEPRRDDALRREVRRRGARRRGRGRLARALRRHARPLDGRDRPVRRPLRELGRIRRAPDRGGHGRRGVRAPARPRRARRTSSAASSSACARRRRSRSRRAPAAQVEIRSSGGAAWSSPRWRGSPAATLRDLSDRIRQQEGATAVLVGSTRRRPRLPRLQPRPVARRPGPRRRRAREEAAKQIGGGGGGRPTLAEAGGKNPDGLGDALDAARDSILAALS